MPSYQRKDYYWQKAKEQGLPSRASFKIEEILKRFPLVQSGDWVLDLGSSPGGWSLILTKSVKKQGRVLALDLQTMNIQAENLDFFQGDFHSEAAQNWLQEKLGQKKIKALFSDMSPKLSGVFFKDAYDSYQLCLGALRLAKLYLKKGGHLVSKIFPGEEFPLYLQELKKNFAKVKTFEPQATRKSSREVYVLAMNYLDKENN
ncbi:MAG: RlmE family RNA methyltransferase [Deltaproteobacteria bacterium]|nr:RlmE family RNA methyltransferase [Deltaproteobacteria bacterium]